MIEIYNDLYSIIKLYKIDEFKIKYINIFKKFIKETMVSIICDNHDLRNYGYSNLDSSIDKDNYIPTASEYLYNIFLNKNTQETLFKLYNADKYDYYIIFEESELEYELNITIPILSSIHPDNTGDYYNKYIEILGEMYKNYYVFKYNEQKNIN